MKRICTLILLLIFVFSFASPIGGRASETIEAEKLNAQNILNAITEDTQIILSASSRLYSKYNGYKFNKEKLEDQKAALKTFLEGLYMLIDTKNISTEGYKSGGCDYYADLIIKTNSGEYRYRLCDNIFTVEGVTYEVDNPNEIAAYFASAVQNGLNAWPALSVSKPDTRIKNINIENKTYDSYNPQEKSYEKASFVYVEKLKFDILLDNSYYDTIIAQVSDADKEIHCTIEQLAIGHPVYLLTLEGNKGKKQFAQEEYSWGSSGSSTGNALEFALNHKFDGKNTVLYDEKEIRRDCISFKGGVSNGDISKITMSFIPLAANSEGTMEIKQPSDLSATNIQYEYYGTDEQFRKDSRNLSARFGIQEKEVEIKKPQGNDVKQQDPEHYVTEMRGVYENGSETIDFYIDFMAKAKLTALTGNQPQWFSALGNNVEVSIISVVQTLNGKPRMGYPMIRFKGSRGTQWFDVDTVEAAVSPGETTSHVKDDNTVYATFNSLLSFEGFTKIKNTVSYDTFSIYMRFADLEKTELKSIEMNFENQTVTIDAKNIDYIGGGKGTYENWW